MALRYIPVFVTVAACTFLIVVNALLYLYAYLDTDTDLYADDTFNHAAEQK